MRRIQLRALGIQNFKSFAEPTLVEFTEHAGLKFLTGANEIEPRLGANGAGKSSLWDALCFCLYGTSVKGHRASSLTTWGAKQIVVTAVLAIDGDEVIIERQGSPDKIEILGKPSAQADIDRLLGLTKARFLQAVLFGQAVPLFLDLSIPARGELLDDVLDLGIWLRLADKAGARHKALTKELEDIGTQIAHQEGRIEALKDIAPLEKQAATWADSNDFELMQILESVEEAEAAQAEAQQTVTTARARLAEAPNLSSLQKQISTKEADLHALEAEYQRMFREMTRDVEEEKYYKHTKTCQVCKQGIAESFAKTKISQASKRIQSFKAAIQANAQAVNMRKTQIEELRAEYDTAARKRDHFVGQVASAQALFEEKARLAQSVLALAERKAAETNPYAPQLEARRVEAEEAKRLLSGLQGQRRRKSSETLKLDFWRDGFKRVRLFMVKRILSQMELETENAASALGLPGWRIKFTTETETKSGTQKQGVQIQVFSPSAKGSWEVWSGGESQRIRIAISIGIASMIQRMAGVSFGLEVWDEPSSWLSPEGIEDLLECLRHRAETTNKSVWVADHRALQHTGFSEIWQVTKSEKGSAVALLSGQEGE